MRAKNPSAFVLSVGILCLLTVHEISSESACRKGCPTSDNGLLQYAAGNVYEYNFDSVLTVGISANIGGSGAAESDDTNLKVSGTAKLFSEGNCGYTLQLGAVKVQATKESIEKKITQSIQKPVHFTLVSGKVQPELCTDNSDTTYALNVKRAIISLFHASTEGGESVNEIDVFGQCPTHTSVSKIGGAEIITKMRNLNSCAYREHIRHGIVSGVVNDKAGAKNSMLLQADYAKESKLERGVLENVQLVEEYKFTGSPKGGPGVRAKVLTTLRLKDVAGSPAAPPATGNNAQSIIFQKPEIYAAKNIAALKITLGQTVQSVDKYVQKNAGKHFVELIRLMRNADTESLLELAAFPHPNKVLARRVYLDALFRTGTAESAKAILKQVNKMDEKEKKIALLSLNLVQVVDQETLNAAAALVSSNSPNEVYLAVGSIVSKYCQRNSCDHGEVDSVSKKFSDALKRCKANTKKDEERIVNVLKGIRNTQHIASNVASVLAECATTGPSTRIRVAALQAFSAAACEPLLQKKAVELLHDRNEDSELRIEAYLSAITCPNAELANQIADIVNSETVYQVGGFIASNLKAIRDSTDATRENQRYHLANIRVTKIFPKNYRRYSVNNEVSYKLEALGLSASADYKLIFSQQGFLPRSARLNVTTEIFGVDYNVFEASVRQENVENVLEYYLGPKGLLNKDFDEIMQIIQTGGSGDRVRRSIADETGKFAKKYKTYGTKSVHDLNLDLSLKLFGSEMLFLSLGDNIPGSLEDVIRHFSTIVDDVKKGLSSYNKEFNVHTLFEDSEISYPTGAGFPLEFTTQGFAANKLDFGIEFDVDGLLQQTWQQSKYRLKVVPSIDVNVNVQLGFNAYVLSTGARIVLSGHSATGSDSRFEFTDAGNGFSLDVELPREKLNLIDLEVGADFYIAEQDKDVKSIALKGAKKRKQEPTEDCFNQFEIVGFNICFSTSIPDPAKNTALQAHNAKQQGAFEGLNLARPHIFTLYLTSERKFNIKGKYEPQTPNGSQQWKLNYSTPGSKVSHDTALTFELGTKPRVFGRASFDHPQYHFALEAGVNNDNKELVLYGQYEYNNDIKKNKIGFVKHGNEYRPIIEIQDKNGVTNDINGYRADGKVVLQQISEKQTRYNFENFQVLNAENERVVVNGWADVGPVYFNSELRVAPGQESYFVKSNFKIDNGVYSIGYFLNDEKAPENVFGGSALVKVSEKEINADLVAKAGTWEFDSDTEIEYEKPEGATVINPTKFKGQLALKNKSNIVGSVKVSGYTEGQNKLQVDVEVVRGKKAASVGVKINRNQRAPGDYHLEVNTKLNKHFADLLATCDIKGNVFAIDNKLTTSWGTILTAKGELGQRYTLQDVMIDLHGTAQFSGKAKPTDWNLKVTGAPEKTNSEFKLSRDNAELIKYVGDLQHPQDKITSGKISLEVKNVVNAKGEIKLQKNGKGELTGNIEMLKTEPKHKVDLSSEFHIQAPKYDVDVTVTLDTNKKLYFSTKNIVDKMKFSTKNVAEVADKKISFDANGLVKGDSRLNSEVQGSFTFTCPEGRVVDGTLNRKMTTNPKTGIAQGTAVLQLNDKLPNNGPKRSFSLTGKLEKANLKAREFASDLSAVYTNLDGKKFEVTSNLKHLPKGQFKFIDFIVKSGGDLVNIPIEITFVADEYSAKHAVYRTSGTYGKYGTSKVNGKYSVGERGSPATYEVQADIQAPQSTFKSLEFKSNGAFTKPDIEDGSGTYVAEIHVEEKTGNNQFVHFNTVWKTSRTRGAYNLDLETEQMKGPLKLDGHYSREQEGTLREGNASGKHKYGFNYNYAGKYVNTASDVSYTGSDTASLHYTLDSSFESAKGIDVTVRGQKLDAVSYVVNVDATQAGNKYAVESKFFGSTHKKGLDLRATLPSGAPVVVVGIFELLGERRAKLTLNIKNLAELDLDANTEASYKGVDDFYIVAKWNSVKLNLDNYDLDIRSQRKTINFNLKNAQGVISAGSATYAVKTEKNKFTLEGNGQLQHNGKSQNTNFKLIREHYELATDKEVGFSYTFNGNFGPKNSVSTLKITNKDFNVKISVCEEKKQCTNVQVQSIVTVSEEDVSSIEHSLLVLINLRELGYPHEFELQSKTHRQGLKFQYSLDSNIISNNNMKYQLAAKVLPTSCKVQIKLPSREILLETEQKLPPQGKFFGKYENSVAFYFDKTNKPNDVTRLSAAVDVSGVERVALNVQGHVKFEHPTIRPLTVSGKIDANRQNNIADAEITFDIFRVPEQKVEASCRISNTPTNNGFNITTSQVVRSSGLGFQYDFKGHTALNAETQEFSAGADLQSGASDLKVSAFIFGNKDHVELLVHGLNEQIVQLTGDFNRQKYSTILHTKLQAFGQKPVELHTELQPSLATFSIKREGLLDGSAEVKLGQEAKFNIVGAGKQLFSGSIALDAAKFLQTNYVSNEKDVEAFLKSVETEVQKETEAAREQIKKRFRKVREAIDRQLQLAKDSSPDFSPLKADFENNVNEIAKELERDPSLKQIIESYRKLYTSIAKIAADIAKTSAESYEKLHESFVALHAKLETIFKDTVLPAWEEFSVALAKVVGDLRVEIINLYTKAFQAVLDVLEKYGPTLKNYGKVFHETMKPFNEAAQELYKVIAHGIEELLEELKEWIAKLPTFDALRTEFKDKVEKLKLTEKTLQFVNDFFTQLHVLPVTPETNAFLQKAHEYIEAKLKQQSVDDEKLVEELVNLFTKALRSIWISLQVATPNSAAGISANSLSSLVSTLPYSVDIFSKLPALLSFRFSAFNFLLNENWESVFTKDLFKSWVFFRDFELKGHIADGRYIFTFDGGLVTFPGSCKYILAQDSFDNNFTVVAQLNNGKLKTITLTDRDGGFAEVSDAGVLKINGNAAEFPQHVKGIHAWRKYYTIWLRSEYGVEVMCTSDLKVCHIHVDGFYTSKTRGLLGNGNAEPNDDFVQADGTVAADSATFGNGYGLGKCNPVAPVSRDSQEHTEICNEVFGLDSALALGYLAIDSRPFRQACDHAVANAPEKDKESAACTIATAYGSALKMEDFVVMLPARCLKCSGAPGQRELGQEFTVKIPTNKADVVFVVDTAVTPAVLNNLVTPVVRDVREALKTRGFTDVQIAVVAFNDNQRYPALLTSDNGKLNFQGNVADAQLNGPKRVCENCISQVASDKTLTEVYETVERFLKSIFPQPDESAFRLALDYPFRAGAAKSIVGVYSNSVEYNNLFKFIRAHFAGAVTRFDGALLHLIAPVQELSLEGVPTEKLVGFNSRLVATLDGKDNKKRQKLQFKNDLGVDFVLNNGGWVFATQNFDNLKPEEQKKALNQVTSSIADTLFKTDIVSDCKCTPLHGLHAQHWCTIKSSTFTPNKKPKAA